MGLYLDSTKYDVLAEQLTAAGEFGLDCETYNQPNRTSPQHRARVHCWSVATLTNKPHPRGYRIASGVVLHVSALLHPGLRAVLENRRIKKWAHNAPHDWHAIMNHGVELVGMEDTLQWLRVVVPGRTNYGLKDAEIWALGKSPRPEFTDMVGYVVDEPRFSKVKRCVCGAVPCKKRQISEWFDPDRGYRLHERVEVVTQTEVKQVVKKYAVTDFVEGAELAPLEWKGQTLDRLKAWKDYSRADAVSGIELVDWIRGRADKTLPTYPWPT